MEGGKPFIRVGAGGGGALLGVLQEIHHALHIQIFVIHKLPVAGKHLQRHRFKINARQGKKVGRGTPLDYIFETEEEILSAIEKTILFYRENGIAGERFADTIERVGFSAVEDAVLSDEILKRKDEILKDE